MLPREYYEPSILKEDVYEPCLAEETLAYCRHYSYPDLAEFPKTYSTDAEQPGGYASYAWEDNQLGSQDILVELETSKLASMATWQPELIYPINLNQPGEHALVVAFFTPKGINDTGANLAVTTTRIDTDGSQQGTTQ